MPGCSGCFPANRTLNFSFLLSSHWTVSVSVCVSIFVLISARLPHFPLLPQFIHSLSLTLCYFNLFEFIDFLSQFIYLHPTDLALCINQFQPLTAHCGIVQIIQSLIDIITQPLFSLLLCYLLITRGYSPLVPFALLLFFICLRIHWLSSLTVFLITSLPVVLFDKPIFRLWEFPHDESAHLPYILYRSNKSPSCRSFRSALFFSLLPWAYFPA